MATTRQNDKTQIGLTREGDEALAVLMREQLFGADSDAYKLGIAFALAKGMQIEDAASGGYQTKFNAAGGLDRDGVVRDLITVLRPENAARPYAAAERFADMGIREIARRVAAHESLADILAEVEVPPEEGIPDGLF